MHFFKLVSTLSLVLGYASADAWSDQVLTAHNSARVKYGAANLTWATPLATNTSLYAAKCVFAHSVCLPFDRS